MTKSLISKAEIEKSKLNEQIIKETAQQVLKDFATFGIDIELPDTMEFAYDRLFEQLKIHVLHLLEVHPEKLSALLYQIDLDENKMRNPDVEFFHENEWISEMILEREFMKVLTRHYFRNKG
ncbi:MAG: hypothetical protein K9H49_11110 [Bacteroidales bacterium]|nr:hypothetical protein [Bacteroidales bacterium]MCF8405379.1 hypothetical protein [Bacteroidales bacterium]